MQKKTYVRYPRISASNCNKKYGVDKYLNHYSCIKSVFDNLVIRCVVDERF